MSKENKTLDKQQNGNDFIADVSNRLLLHVHNDIEDGAKWYNIPLAFWNKDSVYVMQEDRCVFVGNAAAALQFITYNEGKYCQSKFPLNGC
jgi:hypothetical protein